MSKTTTGDYGVHPDHNDDEWNGATCTECGSLSTVQVCGDCLEDQIQLEIDIPIDAPMEADPLVVSPTERFYRTLSLVLGLAFFIAVIVISAKLGYPPPRTK